MNKHLTLLDREKQLRDKVSELQDMRRDRLAKLKKLKSTEFKLCSALTEKPCDIGTEVVPSEHLLTELKEHVLTLECLKVLDLTAVTFEVK